MGIVGGAAALQLLKTISPVGQSSWMVDGIPPAYQNRSKLEVLFGPRIWNDVRDKVVVDFGCGEAHEVVELAEHGARHVIGVENYPPWFSTATDRVRSSGLGDRCTIVEEWGDAPAVADVIVCLDSFEHFEKPAEILRVMHRMLKPGGSVWVAFGPPCSIRTVAICSRYSRTRTCFLGTVARYMARHAAGQRAEDVVSRRGLEQDDRQALRATRSEEPVHVRVV